MALVSCSSLTTRRVESCQWLQIKVNYGVNVQDEASLPLVDLDTRVNHARL